MNTRTTRIFSALAGLLFAVPALAETIYDNTNPAIVYTGAWNHESSQYNSVYGNATQGTLSEPQARLLFFTSRDGSAPTQSTYAHWLSQLPPGVDLDATRVLASVLRREVERPFIAALPQAVLANPEGLLAVMGHVDLAWASSYLPLASAGVEASVPHSHLDALASVGLGGFELPAPPALETAAAEQAVSE